jgi:hypothetical protein
VKLIGAFKTSGTIQFGSSEVGMSAPMLQFGFVDFFQMYSRLCAAPDVVASELLA